MSLSSRTADILPGGINLGVVILQMILKGMRLDVITSTMAVNKERKSPEPWGTPIFRGQGDEEKPAIENEEKSVRKEKNQEKVVCWKLREDSVSRRME